MKMKQKLAILLVVAMLLAGCGQAANSETTASDTPKSVVTAESSATPQPTEAPKAAVTAETEKVEATATPIATTESQEVAAPTIAPTTAPKATTAPTQTPAAKPTAAPTQAANTTTAQAAPASVSMAYGELPLNLSAGSDQWWQIDSTDSAYWAVAENINAIRAAGGLSALSVDSGLSATAGARCESFVAGGAFDHSGMTTTSEICAQGGITSASAVCTAWQGSADHYANIMRGDISSMGVACWRCTVDGNSFAYWVVTFS